jgi:type IV pilus assembly protein PilY1
MVTFVIGFSSDAVTWPGYAPAGSGYSTPSGTTDPKMTGPAQQVPYGYDGSFPDLVTGAKKWPSMGVANPTDEVVHALDLWHAALNGRGRFYAVNKAEDLRVAFRDIIGQINTATEPITTSVAASGFNNMRNEVGLFSVGYESKDAWRGYVAASTVLPDDTIVPKEGWGNQTTAQKLDAANITNRVILSWSDYWNGSQYKGGTPLRWNANGTSNLSTAQNALLGLTPGATGITVATNGQNVLNYIRGDKSLEGTSAAQPFRQRVSRQGDIVNSAIWYAGAPASSYALNGYGAFALANKSRTPMLYVGGNDGMLHGFSASDGSEKIAYVPNGAISSLKKLADLGFNNQHQYYVDGSPMTGDVDLGEQGRADGVAHTPDWRTMLVGTMGAGGKGYFVLDVTKPANFSDGNAPQLVLLDRTRGNGVNDPLNCTLTGMSTAEKTACQKAAEENKDIGNITATPVLDENNPMRATQITRMNNNRWAVVLGNGYNSANARPVLLVQYLDGDRELLRVAAAAVGSPNATDNGLAAPRLVDLDGDSRPDVAYAGDNRGNMWKFDLSSALSDDWKVAFNGEPLFTATGPSALGAAARNQIQPITAPPTVRANDRTKTVTTGGVQSTVAVGGMMVAFGTGRNVTKLDPNSAQVQSLYSVLDNTHYCIADIATGGGTVKRLKVNPGNGSTVCPDSTAAAPKPLGAMGPGGAKLAQQEFSSVPVGNEASAVIPKNSDNKLSAGTWSNFDGWYLDLPVTGERLLKATQFYDGSNILAVYTQVPARGTDANQDSPDESCAAVAGGEELQYRTFINIMDGLAPSIQLVDANGDGAYNTQTDQSAARVRVKEGSHTLVSGKGKNKDIDKDREIENTAPMPEQSLRPSWRQLK